jgi:transcriptional repressor NrdR
MKCPYCNAIDDMVIDSRPLDSASVIRRRRECIKCLKRYTTYERLELVPIVVVKKDGSKEVFDRNKVRNGIITACRKRPISIDEIDKIVNNIEYELQEGNGEVFSKTIGDKIIDKLKNIDEIAYMRFASVYKDFDNLDTFINEIKNYNKKI